MIRCLCRTQTYVYRASFSAIISRDFDSRLPLRLFDEGALECLLRL